jgi:hypothetical protein
MIMTYIPSDIDALRHKEQEYIELRGGEFNSFQDIKNVPSCASTHPQG